MRIPRESQVKKYIKTIRQNLERLEALLKEPQPINLDPRPQDRRTELLDQIYVLGVIDQPKLFRMLDQRRIPHTWIGAQSRANYLEMWTAAAGNILYRATEKAIEELDLGRLIAISEHSALSNEVLAEDWDSQEDAAYDQL